jgi:uncharacterized protein involved in exopolysaccharide biosynthesis
MAEEVKGFAEHLSGFKRHWKLAALVFGLIICGGGIFTLSLDNVYRSTGFILIEEPEIPEEIIRSTVTTYTSRQVTELNERILTIGNLIRLIEEYDLYPEKRKKQATELLALDVRDAIAVEIQTRETVTPAGLPRPIAVGFTVSFENTDPEKAQEVASDLIQLYIKENLKARAEQTTETSQFLRGEVSRLEGEIGELENGLVEFKEKYADRLPSMNSSNAMQVNRIDSTLMEIERYLNTNNSSRISVTAQLATVEPTSASRLADGSIVLSPADQLRSLQTQMSVYSSRYSDDHPDVIRTRRDIASVKARFGLNVNLAELDTALLHAKSELAKARERYSADHPDVEQQQHRVVDLEREIADVAQLQLESTLEPDNPAYIALQTSLNTLTADSNALRIEKAELERRLLDYEARLMATPRIEKELAALTRNLSSTANRYWVMRDKQFSAEMGETLENQSKGEEMVLIEPPRVPLTPFKPDRGAIFALTFLFAVVCGLAVTQLADALDHSIRGPAAISSVVGQPPLIEIPYIFTEEELIRAQRVRRIGYAAAPVVALVVAVIVHFAVVPLDVLFYGALQKLGL